MVTTNIWKNRRLRQIILLVVGSIAVLWLLVAILFYNFTVSQHEQSTLLRLAGIANTLSLQIDGDNHERLLSLYPTINDVTSLGQDSIYDEIHILLKTNFEADMLKSPIYTISVNDSGMSYEFGVISDAILSFN